MQCLYSTCRLYCTHLAPYSTSFDQAPNCMKGTATEGGRLARGLLLVSSLLLLLVLVFCCLPPGAKVMGGDAMVVLCTEGLWELALLLLGPSLQSTWRHGRKQV